MKKQYAVPVIALGAGAVGAVLRYIQINTVYEPVTGLARVMAPVSAALAGWSALVVLVTLLYGKKTVPETKDRLTYTEAFGCCKLGLLIAVIAAAVMAFAAVKNPDVHTVYIGGIGVNFFAILGAAAGVSLAVLAYAGYKGRDGIELNLFSVIPAAFFCYLMALEYKGGSTSPVLINYCYGCIAFGAAAVRYFYCAGHTYGRAKAWITFTVMPCCVYFMTLTLADSRNIYMRLIIAAEVLITMLNLSNFESSPDVSEKNAPEDGEKAKDAENVEKTVENVEKESD